MDQSMERRVIFDVESSITKNASKSEREMWRGPLVNRYDSPRIEPKFTLDHYSSIFDDSHHMTPIPFNVNSPTKKKKRKKNRLEKPVIFKNYFQKILSEAQDSQTHWIFHRRSYLSILNNLSPLRLYKGRKVEPEFLMCKVWEVFPQREANRGLPWKLWPR